MWLARFYDAVPSIQAEYPGSRWMFLTLTVRNCPIGELRATLKAMNAAWQRLKDRKEFAPVTGWVRTTEVTRGKDGSAHPHFHCLMMVPSSMLAGKHYVKQARWTELWQECARLDYTPMVDVRAVKARVPGTEDDPLAGVRAAAAETLKYAVKPSDMIDDPEWFLEMTRQLHKMRFVATGGVLKDVLRVDDESEDEMVQGDSEGEGSDDGSRIAFSWRPSDKRYRRFTPRDKPASQSIG